MAEGLDELIEWLISQIAYSGEKGLSVRDFITAVGVYNGVLQGPLGEAQNGGGSGVAAGGTADSPSLTLARKAWGWLMEWEDVLVGRQDNWRDLTLDDVLALPEEQEESSTVSTSSKSQEKAQPSSSSSRRSAKSRKEQPVPPANTALSAPKTRPRLFLSEQALWMAITGHGVDHKRIPLLEWKCLLGIASAKEEGILQGELRVLVGQDKRSVPKRTDFLQIKGYIVKRTIIAKGCRTSKLWLREFAPAELPAGDATSSPLHGIDLSAASLMKDLEPVPWSTRWMGKSIEYPSFGQSIVAIVKAWGVMRLIDLKLKMGVSGHRWQMRVLAKECRRFVAMGFLKYVAAVHQDGEKVFKDCIKFVRDPTTDEWASYLAAGKKTSQYSDQTMDRQPKQLAQGHGALRSGEADYDGQVEVRAGSLSTKPSWVPEKPLANLVFEAALRAGPSGISNPKLSTATVGFPFRRYVFNLVTSMSEPGVQPPHLKHLQLESSLVRTGKTTQYMFRSKQFDAGKDDEEPEQPCDQHAGGAYGFGPIPGSIAQQTTVSDFSELTRVPTKQQPRRGRYKHLPRKPVQPKAPKLTGGSDAPIVAGDTSPARKRARDSEGATQDHVSSSPSQPPREEAGSSTLPEEATPENQGPEPEAEETHSSGSKLPLVTIGEPGSLDPTRRRGSGRRKKSLVLIFRLEKLKDPAFLRDDEGSQEPSAPSPSSSKPSAEQPLIVLGDPIAEDESPVPQVQDVAPLPHTRWAFRAINDTSPTPAVSEEAGQSEEKIEDQQSKDELEDDQQEEMPNLSDLNLESSYNGSAGRLSINADSTELKFSFTPETVEKEPVVIPIENIVNKPDVQDAPDGDGSALVVEAKRGRGRRTWPYIFMFPDTRQNVEQARLFQGLLTEIQDGGSVHTYAKKHAKPAKPANQEKPARSAKPRSKGKAKQTKKRKAADGPFICEKCGGEWKNDVGLKYHQSKSRSSCNPDAVLLPPIERETKRRKAERPTFIVETRLRTRPAVTVKPVEEAEEAEEAPASPLPRRAAAESPRPVMLRKRPIKGSRASDADPRGLLHKGSPFDGLTLHPLPRLGAFSPTSTSPVFWLQGRDAERPGPAMPVPEGPDHLPDSPPASVLVSDSSSKADVSTASVEQEQQNSEASPRKARSSRKVAEVASSASPSKTRARDRLPRREVTQSAAPSSAPVLVTKPLEAMTPPMDEALSPNDGDGAQPNLATDKKMGRRRANGVADKPLQEKSTGESNTGQATTSIQAPMKPVKTAPKLSDAALRLNRVVGIIKDLLSRTGGVFPGGLSLWCAVVGIFIKMHPDVEPPRSSNCQAAVKALEREGAATMHTFGFRTGRGLAATCQLLIRTGVSPSGIVAAAMKDKIQTMHPRMYVPPDFAPTAEELAVIESLEPTASTGSNKRRGKRILSGKVEVLNASFYGTPRSRQATDARTSLTGPAGYSELYGSQAQSPRKRKADIGNFGDSARMAKRMAGSTVLEGVGVSSHLDMDYRGEGLGGEDAAPTERRERDVRGYEESAPQGLSQQPAEHTFVQQEAQYALTPGRHPGRNPGLSTLPGYFFHSGGGLDVSEAAAQLSFFPPNTHLEEDFVGLEDSSSPSPITPETAEDTATAEVEASQPVEISWAPTFTIKDIHNHIGLEDGVGAWPDCQAKFFDNYGDMSFTMDGWMPPKAMFFKQRLPKSLQHICDRSEMDPMTGKRTDSRWPAFRDEVKDCLEWELSEAGTSLLTETSLIPEHLFFNFLCTRSSHQNVPSRKIQWRSEDQFTQDTLPYDDLQQYIRSIDQDFEQLHLSSFPWEGGSGGDSGPGRGGRGRASGRGRAGIGAGGAGRRGRGGRPPGRKVPVLKTKRELSAYPQGPEDYFRGPRGGEDEDEDEGDLGVDWKADDTRIAAFVAVRTLLGGTAKVIDWGLIRRLFPEMKLSALRTFWAGIRKQRQNYIDKLTDRFRDKFLEAYERDEFPTLDFDNVFAFDWKKLVAWTVRLMLHDVHKLPASREALEVEYSLSEPTHQPRAWREDYFLPNRSVWKRFQDASSEAAALPLETAPLPIDDEAIARSWVRALCCTAIDRYSPATIKQKILMLGNRSEADINELLDGVIRELQSQRVLRQSKSSALRPGRPYQLQEAYGAALDKYAQVDKYRGAGAFKALLDACFRRGEPVPVAYSASDGAVMAVLNLQAHGRVRVEGIDPPEDIPFGFEPGNYESRKFPKSYYYFRQRIVPTERYVYNDKKKEEGGQPNTGDDKENEIEAAVARARALPPPGPGPHGELPIWCDFFGAVDAARWTRMLAAIIFIMATKGSMDARQAAAHMRPVADPLEVQMALDWAAAAGLMKPATADSGGGLVVAEWWWLVVARLCEGLPVEEEVAAGSSRAVGAAATGTTREQNEDDSEDGDGESEEEDELDGDDGDDGDDVDMA